MIRIRTVAPRTRAILSLLLLTAFTGGCYELFRDDSYLKFQVPPEELRDIEPIDPAQFTRSPLVTIDEAMKEALEPDIDPEVPPESIDLSIADVRAAVLANNLDLKVEVLNPAIAATSISEEEARFESTLRGSVNRAELDSPNALATVGSMAEATTWDVGLDIPLATGGTLSVDFPVNNTSTNNIFATINPAVSAGIDLSLSQPLLRNAGVTTNLHAIRVARGQEQISEAQTKLEAIRILANADRAYWLVYVAYQTLIVRRQEYELALQQLETARRRFTAGSLPEIEVVRSESGVAERVDAIIQANADLRRRQRDLKRIMNRPDLPMDSRTRIVITTSPNLVWAEVDARTLADFAVANRMEMLELELRLAIDASQIDFDRNQTLPLFVFDFTYTLNGLDDALGGALDQIGRSQFNDWSVGLRAEIPLGNEAAKSRLQRAILTRLQRLATKDLRRQAIEQEVYNVLDTLESSWQRILAARYEVRLASRAYAGEQRQFDLGLRTSTDVLDAASRLTDAQTREVLALADYESAKVDLAFATGTLLGKARVRWETEDWRAATGRAANEPANR